MNTDAGKVRIIAGRWRGTRLGVADVPGLRPTSDRVRETLFNWLMPRLSGARVLDLFAGTGALGLEAVSRGAVSAVLVERDTRAASALRELVARLPGSGGCDVHQCDALGWLAIGAPKNAFDIAFVDPPFADKAWPRVWGALESVLAPGAWVYVECPATVDAAVPSSWVLHREGRTRDVRYALYVAPAGQAAAATLRPDPAAGEPPSQ